MDKTLLKVTSMCRLKVLPLPRLNSTRLGFGGNLCQVGEVGTNTFCGGHVLALLKLESIRVIVKNWNTLRLGHMWNTLMRSLRLAFLTWNNKRFF